MNKSLTILSAILLLLAPMLVGCGGGYAIQGRVIRGPIATVLIVDRDDPRITESNPSAGSAVIEGIFEPNTPSERQSLGRTVADGQGRFSIPVDAFGAGLLEYEAQLLVRREGHQAAIDTIDLPSRRKRVLITLPLGRDTVIAPERPIDGLRREVKPYIEDKP